MGVWFLDNASNLDGSYKIKVALILYFVHNLIFLLAAVDSYAVMECMIN